MKKTFAVVCAALLVFATLMGCSAAPSETDAAAKNGSAIAVISREDGSGTRGAFIELFGIEQKVKSVLSRLIGLGRFLYSQEKRRKRT